MTTRGRIVVSLVVLAVVWAIAFNATDLPFFVVIGAGGLLTGGAGWWIRSHAEHPCPPLRMTASDAGFALAVAAAHYVVGRAAFAVGSELLPALTSTAAAVYGRTGGLPLPAQLLLGAVLTAPLEEVFWRGAVHPHAMAIGRRRWGGTLLPLLGSVAFYTVWHVVTWQIALVAAAALGGLVWSWVVERTGSLGAAMLAHGAWAAAMLLFPIV